MEPEIPKLENIEPEEEELDNAEVEKIAEIEKNIEPKKKSVNSNP
jgi:hypothetical protein